MTEWCVISMTIYQSIGHGLGALLEVHVVSVVASGCVDCHGRMEREQETLTATCKAWTHVTCGYMDYEEHTQLPCIVIDSI